MKVNVKGLVAVSLLLAVILFKTSVIAKDLSIVVSVDNKTVEYTEETGVPYADENGRTLVPLRATMEKLGVKVDWNQEKQSAELSKGDIKVEVPLGVNYITVNNKNITIDSAAVTNNERIYLPIRFVAEAFVANVTWISESSTVAVSSEIKDEEVPEALVDKYTSNAEVIDSRVNVRTASNLNADIVYKLDSGDRVNVVSKKGSWYAILDGELTYYIHADYVKIDEDVNIEEIIPEFTMPTVVNLTSEENKKYYSKVLGTDNWNEQIYNISTGYGIDPVFVKVIMVLESGGNQKTIGANRYYGLMQVSKDFGYDTERMLNDPEYAISCGVEVILGKANAARKGGMETSCYNVAWRYNSFSEAGKAYANKVSSLYEELSGNSRDTIIVSE